MLTGSENKECGHCESVQLGEIGLHEGGSTRYTVGTGSYHF